MIPALIAAHGAVVLLVLALTGHFVWIIPVAMTTSALVLMAAASAEESRRGRV